MAEGSHKAVVTIDAKVDAADRSIKKLAGQVNKLEGALARSERAAKKKTASLDKLEGGMARMNSGIGRVMNILGGAGLIATLGAAAGKIDELSQRSLAYSEVTNNLSIGIDDAAKAAGGMVDKFTLAKQASQALRLGVVKTSADFAEMVGVASKLARTTGQSATQGVEDFTLALARQSPKILDNLGITLKLEEAYQIYAKSLGKTASELTEVEKQQAFAKAAMIKGREAVSGIRLETDGWATELQRLKTIVVDFTDSALPKLGKGLDRASDQLTESLQKIAGLGEASDQFLIERLAPALNGANASGVQQSGRGARTRGVAGIGEGGRGVFGPGDAGFEAVRHGQFNRMTEATTALDGAFDDFDATMAELDELDKWAKAHPKRKRGGGGGAKEFRNPGEFFNEIEAAIGDRLSEIGGRVIQQGEFAVQGAANDRANAASRAAEAAEVERATQDAVLSAKLRGIDEQRAAGVDTITLIEAEKAARLEYLDFLRSTTDSESEILILEDQREQTIHEAKMERLEEERKARKESIDKIVEHAEAAVDAGHRTVSAMLSVSDARFAAKEAALAQGKSESEASKAGEQAADRAKASQLYALRGIMLGKVAEHTAAAIGSAAYGNFPGAAAHAAAAAAFGAGAALAGRLARQKTSESLRGGGGGGGSSFGGSFGPGRAANAAGPTPGGQTGADDGGIPTSPLPGHQAASKPSAANSAPQVNISGNFYGTPQKAFFQQIDQGLKDLGHSRKRASG